MALSGCSGSFVVKNSGAGTLVASASSVDFGSVAVGQTASATVTLVNQGSAPVDISLLKVSGQSFSLGSAGSLPATVAANSSFILNVQFNPAATGAAAGQLTISSDASSGSSTSVTLSGTGVPVLNGLTCSTASITGAGTDDCTVSLNSTAPSDGLGVSLTSSSSAVVVPTQVTIPAGATSTPFTASISPVTSIQAATLTASIGSVAENFALHLGAASPVLSVGSTSLAFGSVPVSSPVTQSLVLSSTGSTAVTVSGATLSGTGYSISGVDLPATLSPGQTATLSVQFDPTVAGKTTGQLTLVSNSQTGSSTTVALSGTGVPVLSALSCGSSSMSGAGTDACTVTLNAAAASGGFTVSLVSSNSLVSVPSSVTVAAGAISASFTATVSPVTSTQQATLTASAGGVSEHFALQLTVGPTLSLSTNSVAFGNVGVNTQATQTLTLSSTGSIAVTINASALSGAGFTASGATFPLTLNPNQTATLNLQFAPTAAGAASGSLTLSSNSATGYAASVNLSGTGVPVLTGFTCASGSMTGAGTDTCTVTLNVAAATGGFAVTLASNNSAVSAPVTVTVPAGAMSASFAATVSAVNVAQAVTLTATAGSVTKTFALQLGASKITLALSATSIAFGSVNVNSTATQSLTLSSTGTSAVTVSAATVSGSGFTVSGATFPLTLSPGQTATLNVQFDPTSAGAASGQLTLTSNSSSGTSTIVTLGGTGVPVLTALSCS
ncbi:MAG: beta strand repeat-containing protein, partial [Terracidiphilus sp.]